MRDGGRDSSSRDTPIVHVFTSVVGRRQHIESYARRPALLHMFLVPTPCRKSPGGSFISSRPAPDSSVFSDLVRFASVLSMSASEPLPISFS